MSQNLIDASEVNSNQNTENHIDHIDTYCVLRVSSITTTYSTPITNNATFFLLLILLIIGNGRQQQTKKNGRQRNPPR